MRFGLLASRNAGMQAFSSLGKIGLQACKDFLTLMYWITEMQYCRCFVVGIESCIATLQDCRLFFFGMSWAEWLLDCRVFLSLPWDQLGC